MAVFIKDPLTLTRAEVQRRGGLVVLDIDEYARLLKQVTPTYYLQGKAAANLDELVNESLSDHALGKTRRIKSLRDLA